MCIPVMWYIILFLCRYYPERPAIGEYDRELNNYRYTTLVSGEWRGLGIQFTCVVQWNLSITNLSIAETSTIRTPFCVPV